MKYEHNKPVGGAVSRFLLVALSLAVGTFAGVSAGSMVAYKQIQADTPHMAQTLADSDLQVEPVNIGGNPDDPSDLQPALGVRLIESNVGSQIAPLNQYYTGPQLQVR